ncbi:histidine kinase [Hahella sp. CCB-MM4]|uniref:oxygenase MpaB family protein n=1 Tax=Hahella sp. (strain CCB-MM4) TaxID=1926491 RepID=UPI000B9C3046|nr:oxygenase MpaB family protein [Hahella sp. CCB-MM4]OZG70025.1 histidine kinase [Hahella sp. CCB-MM4]
MKFLQQRIEQQLIGLTGLALGGIDYESPAGDPGLFGPGSVCWLVHADFPSMLCGGISALMLQMLHPLALSGVLGHSNFREDMIGRLRRTGQFIAGTTYGAEADARRLIERVRKIHDQVVGVAPDGRPYAANDPELLVWVHVAEVYSFLAGYLRYCNPALSEAEQDRYYDEVARIAEALGAKDVPRSRKAVDEYLQGMRSELVFDERAAEVLSLLMNAPAPSRLTQPVGRIMTQAGLLLLPDWARTMIGISDSPWRRRSVEIGMNTLAPTMRWSFRNGASHRARRRMGEHTP